MTSLFKKLNYKNSSEILILNAPSSFDSELLEMENITAVLRNTNSLKPIDFILCFAKNQSELDESFIKLNPLLNNDSIFWICYPKKTSKKYQCDFNRDTGFEKIRAAGLDSVRMVSVDDDWSALRFRNVELINR
ncbi:DUF3052 family protein [Pedobacter psychrophilus]|nr:DUF3052 family protein [Pedobacter psychrophilus]